MHCVISVFWSSLVEFLSHVAADLIANLILEKD